LVSGGIRYSALMLQECLEHPDVFHVLNIPDVLALVPIIKRAKLVYDVRSPWADELRAFGQGAVTCWFAERIERCVTRHADAVIVVNKMLEDRARSWGAKRVYLVPNYPPADFRPTIDSETFRRRQGLSGKKIVLYVGKLSAVECTLDLLKALSDLLREQKETVLVMVGDGPERESIERFAEEGAIRNQIRITGWVPHEEVPNWIAIADVCVLPRREDMPSAKFYSPHSVRKIGEYLALGKPVVVTPVGDFAQTDLPVRVAPLDRFSTTIKEELRNPRSVDRPDGFTWERSEETLLEVYEDLATDA
jgi:glycosyltransferase involved in cell wall biosynthesis